MWMRHVTECLIKSHGQTDVSKFTVRAALLCLYTRRLRVRLLCEQNMQQFTSVFVCTKLRQSLRRLRCVGGQNWEAEQDKDHVLINAEQFSGECSNMEPTCLLKDRLENSNHKGYRVFPRFNFLHRSKIDEYTF